MPIHVYVCHGRSCQERFSPYILLRLKNDRERFFPNDDIVLDTCLCRGKCQESPTIEVDGTLYTRMSPIAAGSMLAKRVAEAKKTISVNKKQKNHAVSISTTPHE
ncbi:MAG TPA: (2Fe-2S) ferredoxin domain-containing protein [bacterium]|nr:(2Fe-2S) ferredoxin domain-containing protein [bacterium]